MLPRLAQQCGDLLNDPITSWQQSQQPLLGTAVNEFQHMLQRVKKEDVEAMIEDSKEEAAAAAPAAEAGTASQWNDTADALAAEPLAETCSIDDFVKIDLRVARIINAEHVPEARKLLKLTVSLGGDVQRTVFAGIKAAYEPEKLIGRLVVIVANLAPRQMKFGLSEGMVTAAAPVAKKSSYSASTPAPNPANAYTNSFPGSALNSFQAPPGNALPGGSASRPVCNYCQIR